MIDLEIFRHTVARLACRMKPNLLLGLFVLSGAASSWAQTTNHLSVEAFHLIRLPDVTLDSVKPVIPDTQRRPNAAANIEVKGKIGGHIGFELLLPDAWNERFVMGGGGGFVGSIQNAARDSVNKGYAT